MREGVQQDTATLGLVAAAGGAEMGIGGNEHSRACRVDGHSLGILGPVNAAAFAPHYEGVGTWGMRE